MNYSTVTAKLKCRRSFTKVMAKVGLFSVISFFSCLPLSQSVETAAWSVVTRQNVSSYEDVTSARSKIECVIKCTAYSHCTSSAFDAATGLCYLHPNTSQGPESPSGLLVYKDKGEREGGGGGAEGEGETWNKRGGESVRKRLRER